MTCHPWRTFAVVAATLATLTATAQPAAAQSEMLESVKQNSGRAQALCQQLRQLNAQGLSSTSQQAVTLVARQEQLSTMDAEVLATYVIGLHCPDVR